MPAVNQRPGLVIFKDTVFNLRADGYIFKYLGTGKGWQNVGYNANFNQLAVGNAFYALDTNLQTTYAYKTADNSNKVIDRNPERKNLAASAKFIYKIHLDQGRIYQYSSKDWNLVDDGVRATAIVVDDDDTLYQLHEGNGSISQYMGSEGWTQIDSTPNVKSILVGGGKLYKVHNDNGIYVHVEDYDWDRLDKNASTVQVAAGPAGLYQKRSDGTILKYNEADKKWDQLMGAASGYLDMAVGEKTVYVRHTNGYIYRYEASNNSWPALT
jgi:hypothetical protein